jgi:2-C-methyl-D-erythritol 4-phosphate cytidylyltransferase
MRTTIKHVDGIERELAAATADLHACRNELIEAQHDKMTATEQRDSLRSMQCPSCAMVDALKAEVECERVMRVAAQTALGEAMRRMPGDVRLPEGMVDRWTAAQTAGAQDGRVDGASGRWPKYGAPFDEPQYGATVEGPAQ